jgi:hypothetical protein
MSKIHKPLLFLVLLLVVVAIALLGGCAAGPNPAEDTLTPAGDVAGFWQGLWHGLILPISFIVSLFSDGVSVYEAHNNGEWYNFGFFLGVACALGGTHASRRRRCGEDKG